jgi:hypothetical protein
LDFPLRQSHQSSIIIFTQIGSPECLPELVDRKATAESPTVVIRRRSKGLTAILLWVKVTPELWVDQVLPASEVFMTTPSAANAYPV